MSVIIGILTGIFGVLKQFFSLFAFDTFKKEEYKPFKDKTNKRLDAVEKASKRSIAVRKLWDKENLHKVIDNQFELIERMYQRLIADFEKFDHNERNFSNFLIIQNQSVREYDREREEYHNKNGSDRDLVDICDQSMHYPISHIKKNFSDEIIKTFTTYDKLDRKEVIIGLLNKYCLIVQEKFKQELLKNKRVIQIYT